MSGASRADAVTGPQRARKRRVVVTDDTCFGRPRIDDSRIEVADMLRSIASYLEAGEDWREVVAREWPHVGIAGTAAGLRWAARVVDRFGIAFWLERQLHRRVRARWKALDTDLGSGDGEGPGEEGT